MKNLFIAFAAFLFLGGVFTSCLKDKCVSTKTFVRFDPIYLSAEQIRGEVTVEAFRELKSPGKIYVFQNYLLINEINEGIHIFDNSHPENPIPLAFLKIAGNVDMAVRGNYLYADQYTDLLTFDISNMLQPQLTCRAENVFQLYGHDPYRGYLVGYTQTDVTETLSCDDDRANQVWWRGGPEIFVAFDALDNSGRPNTASSNTGNLLASATGVSGSYARISFNQNYLYAVDNSSLYPFSLSSPDCPTKGSQLTVGWNIETIFPWKNYLFLGSQNGVYMYDARNPNAPTYVSFFQHATGCDPVVCDDKNAYVTIHDGTTCNGTNINQLDIIGIEHMPQTSLLKSYPMVKPFGLSLRDNLLFLCDDGLKIFDRSDVYNLKLLSHTKQIKAWDIISLNDGLTMVVGEDGFLQFDTSDPANPREISRIAVSR
ncbi:MAG TPA: hypothetical protein PKC40_03100 [Saprospiraceae bacterium]|nr:hypothetical protein [Saprospiraceae bacterium]